MLLSESPGLGGGVPYDWQTVIIMAVIGIAVGLFVLYFVWKYPESERKELYDKLGFGVRREPCGFRGRNGGRRCVPCEIGFGKSFARKRR